MTLNRVQTLAWRIERERERERERWGVVERKDKGMVGLGEHHF
jgi:hypothetical protein